MILKILTELNKVSGNCLFQLTEIYVDSKRNTETKKAKRQHFAGVLTLMVPRGGQKRRQRF